MTGGRAVAACLLGVLAALALGPGGEAPAQVQRATVSMEHPGSAVKEGSDLFTVSVMVSGAQNLGAFEMDVAFDPSVIGLKEIKEGPFLGSSGRTVQCLPPQKDSGAVHFVCITLGPTPPGADGSGVLAVLDFEPVGVGTSPLEFRSLSLANPEGNLSPSDTRNGSVTVVPAGTGGGFNWALWGGVIAGVGAAVLVGGLLVNWRRLRT